MLRSLHTRLLAHPGSLWLKRAQALFFVNGVLGVLIVAQLSGWPSAVQAVDVEQQRLNIGVPVSPEATPTVQTFQARRDGLTEIELLVTGVGDQKEKTGDVTVLLSAGDGKQVAGQTWQVAELRSNQSLLLRFPVQTESAGEHYTLSIQASPETNLSLGGYDQDVYREGTLTISSETSWELRFVTRYQLTAGGAVRLVGELLWQNGLLLVLAPALILMPGILLLLLLADRLPRWDPAAWWGVALAVGVACWPLLWYWLTLAGGRWADLSLGAVVAGGWGVILWLWWQRKRQGAETLVLAANRYHLLLLLLLGVGFAVRLLAVRDLAFPPWVDPTRHALITQVMIHKGQFLREYAPFLEVDRFPYHGGFHTLPAGLSLLGLSPLPRLLLILGQWLNGLVPLTVYTAASLVTRRRTALLAAFFVALPSFFPAYYSSWGRFTQLTGVLLLPVLLAVTWKLLADKKGQRLWWVVALMAAGLAFIHFRVFLVYLPFAGLAWVVQRGRHSRALAGATLLALLLAGPRLWELQRMTVSSGLLSEPDSGYNQFPTAYLAVGWEQWFLVAGGLAMIIASVSAFRFERWALFPLTLAAWSAVVILLLTGAGNTWLINFNSAYIIFFIPLALLLAGGADRVARWWRRQPWPVSLGGALGSGVLLAVLFLYGVQQQVAILNPTTRLARPADLEGLAWIEENLPAEATLAVNSWHWLGASWAGTDGGAWITPITGRKTTTPPADYVYNRELLLEVAAFNEAAEAIEDWADPAAAGWLKSQGVTHIFVGARGGFFDPSALLRNPALQLEFARDGVFIFAVEE